MAILRSGAPSMRRAEGSSRGRSAGMEAAARAGAPPKKKIDSAAAWREFRELLWVHRRRLTIGLTLMLISRLSGIVLPALSKYVIDDVIGKGRHELLVPIALAAGAATIVQAITSRSEEHTSELQSPCKLVCRPLLEKKKVGRCNPKEGKKSTRQEREDSA